MEPGGNFVRKLDYHRTPEAKDVAERIRTIADENYPKVCAILWDATNKVRDSFDITLKRKVRLFGKEETGVAFMHRIMLNKTIIADNLADLDFVIVHEMAHVAQDYWRFPFHVFTPGDSDCWVEGMADYVDFKLGLGDGPFCAECAAGYPHYKQGYNCAGAFLLYLDETYGSSIIRQLNLELWQHTYKPEFFFRTTGKTLGQLWMEFKNTDRYTPVAESFNQIHAELGYEGEKTPANADRRFDAYLKKHFDEEQIKTIRDDLEHLALANADKKNPANLYAWSLFEKTPAGEMSIEAMEMVKKLNKQERLPILDELPHDKKHPFMAMAYLEKGYTETYPASRTFAFDFKGYPFRMHITLTKETTTSQWVAKRFWTSTSGGKLLKEYPLR